MNIFQANVSLYFDGFWYCIKIAIQYRNTLHQDFSENSTGYKMGTLRRGGTAQNMKFSSKDFFSKCDEIRSFLRIWSHLLKKSLMKNLIFYAVRVKGIICLKEVNVYETIATFTFNVF